MTFPRAARVKLPRAARPFVTFASVLRRHGFPVAPEQTASFIAAVGLLGPRGMSDVYHAALATLAPDPDRRDEFDALYRAHFLGHTLPAVAPISEEEIVTEPEDGEDELFQPEEESEAGGEATRLEVLAGRRLDGLGEDEALRRFRRTAPTALPLRRSRRFGTRRSGERPDLRRALREAVKRDGEVVRLPRLARRNRQRRILLLVDVSGSMKGHTDGTLRFAHALRHAAERVEVFTVGTRLTRITRALRHRNPPIALDAASAAVADWDGGTRLGDALQAFLAVPRYAGFARSALVVIVSDGLERGDPAALVAAAERLSRLAWAILWLTPLASGASFRPETEALKAVAPFVTRFGAASSPAVLASEILTFARAA